jgi:hypothetical protein
MTEQSHDIVLKIALLNRLLLHKGKMSAITGEKLVDEIRENNDYWYVPPINNRAMRLTIQELISEGHPICSSPGRKADPKTNTPKQEAGYFYANNPTEIKEALKVLRSYGKQIFHHYYNLKKAGQKAFSGQLSMFKM